VTARRHSISNQANMLLYLRKKQPGLAIKFTRCLGAVRQLFDACFFFNKGREALVHVMPTD
jgi:hypothetical protein